MSQLRQYSLAACVLLVVLRLAIGWQLLYEGLWKISTLDSARPWSSAGYLKNSVGPMRDTFREMSGDPNELDWLNYDVVSNRWKQWAQSFQTHYRLNDDQASRLNGMLYGRTGKVGDRVVFAEALAKLPSGVDKLNVSEKIVWFDAKAQRIYIDASRMMTPSEKAKLESLVKGRDDKESKAFVTAIRKVYDRQKKTMGYLRRLGGALNGDPDLLGNKDWQRLGEIDQYRQQLAQYEADYAKATTQFEWDHLKHVWGNIQSLRSDLTGPIKAMEADFQDKATTLLTVDQQSRGPVPAPWTTLRFADTMTIIGLTALGTLLILGLFTRFAAVAAAFMLFNFYLAMPPLPGVPAIPGPEHSFIVNKNLIEVFALLAIAALPSGIWFGLDRLLSVFFAQWAEDGKVSKMQHSSIATGDEPADVPEVAPA